jgi:hypothetical protein
VKAVEHVKGKLLLDRWNTNLLDDGTLAFKRFGGSLRGGLKKA